MVERVDYETDEDYRRAVEDEEAMQAEYESQMQAEYESQMQAEYESQMRDAVRREEIELDVYGPVEERY